MNSESRYWCWVVFAIMVYIPALVANNLLWRFKPCEWSKPYQI